MKFKQFLNYDPMKHLILTSAFLICIQCSFANLLYDIVDGKFSAKTGATPISMNDGEHYTVAVNGNAVVKYD